MWLGLQALSSLERCPLFRVAVIERFHCITTYIALHGEDSPCGGVGFGCSVSLQWVRMRNTDSITPQGNTGKDKLVDLATLPVVP